MKPENSPFRLAWMSFDLGNARPSDGTYTFFPYDSLPDIPDEATFVGKFEWLGILPEPTLNTLDTSLNKIKEEAQKLNITLPQGFELFMGNALLQNAIPSCTACYFDLSTEFTPAPIEEGGYFLRFMNDQQNILLWYLYLSPTGDHCVIVSNIDFDDTAYFNSLPGGAVQNSSGYCAPSFEAFLYRFWLENRIWFKIDEGGTMDDTEKQYLEHYA